MATERLRAHLAEDVKQLLDEHFKKFGSSKHSVKTELEQDLKSMFEVDSLLGIKEVVLRIAKDVYPVHPVIIRYMEEVNASGPVQEYKAILAKAYGIESYDNSPERDKAREAYWDERVSNR